ncbi:hypothetical protein B0H10DRAFT_904091 [Mycena sp. CBHHK59/15]|nr:hypothetical protein B0H10DRAFT_904091 [Mycena sp. CBHHK59/15]
MTRDGAMYFAMICLANLANILIFYLGDANTSGGLSWCTAAISVSMISRLMLNLHEAAAPEDETDTHATNLGSIRFAHSRPEPEGASHSENDDSGEIDA